MTNRTKRGKSRNSLRLLDLSFDGSQDGEQVSVSSSGLNNGFRPHGGHRGIGDDCPLHPQFL